MFGASPTAPRFGAAAALPPAPLPAFGGAFGAAAPAAPSEPVSVFGAAAEAEAGPEPGSEHKRKADDAPGACDDGGGSCGTEWLMVPTAEDTPVMGARRGKRVLLRPEPVSTPLSAQPAPAPAAEAAAAAPVPVPAVPEAGHEVGEAAGVEAGLEADAEGGDDTASVGGLEHEAAPDA
jgi:hypothetical protein